MASPPSARGTVHASAGGVYDVVLESGERVEASLRGRLKKSGRGSVVIGDRVAVAPSGDVWVIESAETRTTQLARRARGGRTPKVLAANLDRVLTVVGLRAPPASAELIDRLLALVESSLMHPILVLNKVDLEGAGEVAARLRPLYEDVGYRVLVTSAAAGDGIEELRALVCEGSSALIGPSGVGKSTLLNALDPALDLRTGALSGKTGTGRHTTVGSRLIALDCGGLVADTPGFGDVGLWVLDPADVSRWFPDLEAHADGCRFRSCTHMHEPDCAVIAAVERGDVHASRYRSYGILHGEAGEAPRR